YAPDPSGDRSYEGTRLSKTPKDGSAELAGAMYDDSGIRFGALEVEKDAIEECVSPYRDREVVLANMDEQSRDAYDRVDTAIEDHEVMVIGSDTFDVGTDSSDLDLVWIDDYDEFHAYRDVLEDEAGLQEVGEDWLEERIEDHAERYEVPEEVAAYHHMTPQQRFFDDDLKVGFSPSHVPGTFEEYYRPEPGDSGVQERFRGQVTDTTHNDSWPRMVELETEEYGDLCLETFFWAYGGSFEEGDELVVEGELFEEEETVLIRDRGQYAVPRDEL
ncbi:MAG: hypothetical protein SVU32_02535, partial [Candidatus Nanohaloarchaea archaeon]|nr:hypothetical protein [Candidatus Nanohaloarchaea archaeon]